MRVAAESIVYRYSLATGGLFRQACRFSLPFQSQKRSEPNARLGPEGLDFFYRFELSEALERLERFEPTMPACSPAATRSG
jgi:hypothetical protein